ncbi:unnamed protein product [Paramecium octaurelia]|uniref:Uncharacterized protein n=1 Tax=Paramecium octaurelia TaxID=43137 RepID=A0A8S1V2L6_PAROT|nr:unnamed protein product [Paramecium octaurelia]
MDNTSMSTKAKEWVLVYSDILIADMSHDTERPVQNISKFHILRNQYLISIKIMKARNPYALDSRVIKKQTNFSL